MGVREKNISIRTDFISGGGTVSVLQTEPVIVRVKPHNEGVAGWSQTWWHCCVEGLEPGKELTVQLESDVNKLEGISPKAFYSYDQKVWARTDTGEKVVADGRELYIYRLQARSEQVWFAYDLPYTTEHLERLLLPVVKKHSDARLFELCTSRNGRGVTAFSIQRAEQGNEGRHGIWLQARAHAFESGASWVLHELALWLLSEDPLAASLRSAAQITVVPVVDVDGVVEGRSGKYQKPYDHWMNWHISEHHWPEIRTIKNHLSDMAKRNILDMFIDFHGPGSLTHPYFILPEPGSLASQKQRDNRKKFFEVLGAEPMDDRAKKTQSMTRIHYSPRPLNATEPNSSEWVALHTTDHNIAMTIEVNMNTHLSTQDGYRAEGRVLGQAIANYFTKNNHTR